ncbi:MAG: sulfite reductase, dissimilatory-type subunit alpha, partial [Acidobacteria bacterium]|nr:sulfite reductase, dissimilatory-type subunit alpha [Acidobacteriota bacterium]
MSEKTPPTPLLDELEKGPWPSFVKELKKEAHRPMVQDLLGLLERSYEERVGHWKHGGLVGVMGYGGGVIGRYSDLPTEFPACSEFHTVRVNQPAGLFYTSDALRELCDIWDRTGSGLTNMHGSTGDLVLLGTTTDKLEPIFAELTAKGWDLGGSGSDMRTPSCCVGMARCEWSCYDTMNACYDITQEFQDELHRPMFPYKYKMKFAGCPNDCVASIARSDCSVIGTWKDDIQVDAKAVTEYAKNGVDVQGEICDRCPTALHEVGRQD